MAYFVRMPQKGLSEESVILSSWYIKEGDTVEKGTNLFAIETGKATFDVEAEAAGTVLKTIGEEGDEVPVRKIVCVIGKPGESFTLDEELAITPASSEVLSVGQVQGEQTLSNAVSGKSGGSEFVQSESIPKQINLPVDYVPGFSEIKISPRAKIMALEKGIDYRFAKGSGPNGRVIERDIEQMIESGPFITDAARPFSNGIKEGSGLSGAVTTQDLAMAVSKDAFKTPVSTVESQAEYRVVRISHIRKIIGDNMHNSLACMAQLTHNSCADATCIINFRSHLKANGEKIGLTSVTFNDIIMYVVAHTILDFPELNAHYSEKEMKIFNTVNLGMAVDTPRGLLVPTVMHAEKLSLCELGAVTKELSSACQTGNIAPEKLSGASFTVSNLGVFGISSFTPIINPPQTGILGVCNIEYKIRMKNGEPEFYPAINLSLTYDHRAIDGAPASRFLQALVRNIENFDLLLAK